MEEGTLEVGAPLSAPPLGPPLVPAPVQQNALRSASPSLSPELAAAAHFVDLLDGRARRIWNCERNLKDLTAVLLATSPRGVGGFGPEKFEENPLVEVYLLAIYKLPLWFGGGVAPSGGCGHHLLSTLFNTTSMMPLGTRPIGHTVMNCGCSRLVAGGKIQSSAVLKNPPNEKVLPKRYHHTRKWKVENPGVA
ncbi:hypothetical protein P154DRAFT_572154 [Amniculicola lignicola CBS 123094]|uniref:Uncharacterized protein n=1 Tax=Amniculicola lignicola CBS 123094 TaxID=1392246 RepID=A0A6A5WZK2_9PLEO|nr:hypothetical protein P154DRAFT_572154 [Amniculicola lignicola CBS 123094]